MKPQTLPILCAMLVLMTGCQSATAKCGGVAKAVKVGQKKPLASTVRSNGKKPFKTLPVVAVPETRTEKITERIIETTTVVTGDDEINKPKR